MDRFLMHAVALAFFCAPFVAPLASLGHPGGLDHDGGHIDKKTGKYHLHRLDYSAEAKSRSAGSVTSQSRSAPRASSPGHIVRGVGLTGVGEIPTDLLTTTELTTTKLPNTKPSTDSSPAKVPPTEKATPTPLPTKPGLMTARTGWALPADQPDSTSTDTAAYVKEHSLQLRTFHDAEGKFVCIGEVSATSHEAVTIVLANGGERKLDFDQLSYADRAFITAQHDRAAADLADELARDHGYRVWRLDRTGSTLKAKAIAYDGTSVRLKGKTPSVATYRVSDLDDADQAHLQQLAALFESNATALAQANRAATP